MLTVAFPIAIAFCWLAIFFSSAKSSACFFFSKANSFFTLSVSFAIPLLFLSSSAFSSSSSDFIFLSDCCKS